MDVGIKPANVDFEAAVRASFARQGLMGAIGAWLVDVKPGSCVIEVPYAAKISQQQGFFHGGIIGAIGDTAGGYAALSLMPAGLEVLTVDYTANFVRPATGELLRAEGRVLRSGRTLTVARIDVSAVAAGRSTACGLLQATYISAPAR